MAAIAVSLESVYVTRGIGVMLPRNCDDVLRVNANAILIWTLMVTLVRCQVNSGKLHCETVSPYHLWLFEGADLEAPVLAAIEAASPQPTRFRIFDLLPEALLGRLFDMHEMGEI
jgi:hypothetical protein